MPRAKASEMRKALRVVSFSCWLTKPTISGMLARWQGLSRMLNIPQMKAPSKPEQRMAVQQLRHPGKKRFQHYFTPFCLQDLDQFFLGKEALVAEIFLALLVQEDLGGDDADFISLARKARPPGSRRRGRPP